MTRSLLGLEIHELHSILEGPEYRALQLFEWIYARGTFDFLSMTNLPQELRQYLQNHFSCDLPQVMEEQHARDGSTKYVLKPGTEVIEAVHMPEDKRDTLCISSQAGCSFGCKFCVTARMNLRRNLAAGEILGEILAVLQRKGKDRRLNIVFMGMGEPLHNYESVMKAFRIMTHPRGLAISPRRITVSTVGLVPALLRLKNEPVIPNLAVSLNAPENSLRSELMPINRIYPIEILMQTLLDLPMRHRQRITFEYVLLKGVNDSAAHARRLLQVTAPIRCKLNVIPFNPDPHLPYERPDEDSIHRFVNILSRGARTVAVRRSRGPDISAACGQLGTQYIDPRLVPHGLTT